jgi:phytoene desaturase
MYLGVSPFDAPAIYSVVNYMETGLGIWYPKGGMYSLSQGLEKLVKDLGGTILTSTEVSRISVKNQSATGVILKNGKHLKADLVVANSDLVYSYLKLINSADRPSMPDSRLLSYRQASSALLFYWGVEDDCEGMMHHNVYLSRDFKKNLDEIFYEKKMPNDPSFYTYIPTKTDPSLAPKGKQVFYVLVPVPNLSAKLNWNKEIVKIRQKVINRLKTEFNLDIEKRIETEKVFTPQDFKKKFNLHMGSAFGLSHNFLQSGYFRPHNKSRDINNLYFVGASTYPGGGIPMVTLSAKLVVERILDEAKN